MEHVKRWLKPHDLLDEYGISISMQNRLRSEKRVPYARIGRQIRYDRLEIDKWLEDHKIA